MRVYLTRENENYWMLTHTKPLIKKIGKVGPERVYVRPGDIIGYRFVCAFIAKMFYNNAQEMNILETVKLRAKINGTLIKRYGKHINNRCG